MSILSFFGCGKKAPEYPADTLTTRDGTQITLTFFKHASLAIEAGGKYIYVDPVSGYADYAALPKADVVLITHSHYDHLDVAAVEAIQTPQTEILCDRTSAEAFEMNCYTMRPGPIRLAICSAARKDRGRCGRSAVRWIWSRTNPNSTTR